ncbi:hypothetical protein Tco_1153837 [Tanacetum coccineum]|uniref:Uncharacterized protein n=1 Tax=Tanacetum coccineum TaxID=301880 RepID=A0ABQ5E8E1_9ASTR
MTVQAQQEQGEGSDMPTITQPSSSQPQKKHKPRKPKKKDTQIPQSNVSSDNLADEVVNEENVSKHSNDPLLNSEDRLKLEELMALCTNLQNKVLDLEHTKTTQALEIDSLKRRVKKLEKKQSQESQGLEDCTMGWSKLLAKVKIRLRLDYELAQRLQAKEQEELTIKEKSKLFQQLLEKRRKHFAAKRAEERRNKPPTKAQQRSIMCTYLKNMAGWKPKDLKTKSFANVQELFDKAMKRVNTFVDMDTELVGDSEVRAESSEIKEESSSKDKRKLRSTNAKKQKLDKQGKEDLEVLWRIVKARFKKTEPVNYMNIFLHLNLKTMFEHHVEDMQSIPYYLLVKKMYPLTKHTLHQMFNNVKLQVDYECEMAYELLRLVKKQLKEGYVPE